MVEILRVYDVIKDEEFIIGFLDESSTNTSIVKYFHLLII